MKPRLCQCPGFDSHIIILERRVSSGVLLLFPSSAPVCRNISKAVFSEHFLTLLSLSLY